MIADDDPTIPKAMTVLGPVAPEALGSVLMNEPLICDFTHNKAGGKAIVWDDMAALRQDPFTHADNMTLSSTRDVSYELVQAKGCCQTLLTTTPLDFGRDPAKAKTISEQTGIHILLGTTPSCQCQCTTDHPSSSTDMSVEASKVDIDRMEQELLYGVQDDTTQQALVRAGFIGELDLSSSETSAEMTASQLRQLKACAVVQHTTKAPFLLSVPPKHIQLALNHIESCGGDLSRTVLAHMDLHGKNNLALLKQVLDRGVCICFDRFAVSSAIWDLDGVYPSVKNVTDTIQALLQDKPEYLHQILVSSGIFMKLQYAKYGGVGYGIVMDHLVPRLLQQKTLSQSQTDTILHENPRRLLCWWTPPPPKEKPKEYLPCSVCKKMFEPILGEYYTKYNFSYCGTDCLRKHRKMGFKG